MTAYRGLTWDHPRGRDALVAAAAEWSDQIDLRWDVHPLEGFESSPIEKLAETYDLIVLDHPHLGDALAHDSLIPMTDLFSPDEIGVWAEAAVGPSLESYRFEGKVWALPLDAATQVSARRAELVEHAPETWTEVRELARTVPVALSIAGPHAFLSFCSIAVALGEEPGTVPGESLISREAARDVLSLMRELVASGPASAHALNPIQMLETMRRDDSIAYCPLIYGYVNYSRPRDARSISFGEAPAKEMGGRRGSTIGGTGIAVSRRCDVTEPLLELIRWLMSPRTQTRFIPAHNGQPSARPAWTDPLVNAASAGFFRSSLATIESSWMRPRFPGYIAFQSAASALIRDATTDAIGADDALDRLEMLHRKATTTTEGTVLA